MQGFVTLQEALVDAVVRLVDRGSGDAFVLVSVFPCLLKRPLWKGFALSCTCTRMFREIDLHRYRRSTKGVQEKKNEGCVRAFKSRPTRFLHSHSHTHSVNSLTRTLLTNTCFVLCRRSLCLCRIRKRSSMRAQSFVWSTEARKTPSCW